MRLGVNTVDIFSGGDHIALNVRSDLDDFALVEAVKRTHQELAVDVIELPANLMVICPRLFRAGLWRHWENIRRIPALAIRCIYPLGGWTFLHFAGLCGKPALKVTKGL